MKVILKRVNIFIYDKLFKINDSPRRIAVGFGLGIFCGLLPGTGPLAALFLSFVFKVNRLSALLASLISNTWLSLATFIFSIRVGSAILGMDQSLVYNEIKGKWGNVPWQELFKTSLESVILPIFVGYLVVSVFLGLVSYFVVLIVLRLMRK